MPIRWHEEDPTLLREAINFTAAETGFVPRLVEKDYFCSVVLEYLAASGAELIFKGGTCLTKVHGSLYRLSEDLDFSISTPLDSGRPVRRRSADRLRTVVASIPAVLSGFEIVEPLAGSNQSTQYNAEVGYRSLLDGHVEPVRIEVGIREPMLLDTHAGIARTLLLNPINRRELVDACSVASLSYAEAMAEKLRAALCRREVAIRDFFDVDHAVQRGRFDSLEPTFLDLLKRKIEIPGTGAADVSDGRVEQLRRQVGAELRPVLREREFAQFDLARAVEIVRQVARELARR